MKHTASKRGTPAMNRNAPNGAGDRSQAADLAVPEALPLSTRPPVDPSRVGEPRVAFGLDLDPSPAHHQEFEQLVRRMLELLGEAPERAGLLRTPQRVANALTWLTRGYALTAAEVIDDAIYEKQHESMILVRDIELYSLCEHHLLLPFFGRVHVAYIPHGKIVGLSKIPRIVEVYARRLQVQERLTEEITQALTDALAPRGVGVVVEAVHLCMMMRGVEKQNSKTITSAVRGAFRTDPKTRDEFLRLSERACAARGYRGFVYALWALGLIVAACSVGTPFHTSQARRLMAQVKDPVCGMMIDRDTAAAQSQYEGRTYYFCSEQCLRQFESDPARYAGAGDVSGSKPHEKLERHEPPYTKSGGMVAPKFGAAGSGGAEYERLPEAHDDREKR